MKTKCISISKNWQLERGMVSIKEMGVGVKVWKAQQATEKEGKTTTFFDYLKHTRMLSV